jgi:transcriptional regulator with XRE-family HTH domain
MTRIHLIEQVSRAAKISREQASAAVETIFNHAGSVVVGAGFGLGGFSIRQVRLKKRVVFAREGAAAAKPEPSSRGKRPTPEAEGVTTLSTRPSRPRSATQIAIAEARIRAGAEALPSPAERRAASDILQVVAPDLCADSGRLDARRVAASMGLSLRQLARVAGVTQQALSATPDSRSIQGVLRPIARLSAVLDQAFPGERKRAWLQSPNPALGDIAPAEAIAAGRAEVVLLKVENALAGHPD